MLTLVSIGHLRRGFLGGTIEGESRSIKCDDSLAIVEVIYENNEQV